MGGGEKGQDMRNMEDDRGIIEVKETLNFLFFLDSVRRPGGILKLP
jgi:hypothetical protein